MRIAMVSFEVFPFAKVGGLADVIGALPKYLSREGLEIDVYMPFHSIVMKNAEKYGYEIEKVFDDFDVPFLQTNERISVYSTYLPDSNCKVYLIDNKKYFSSDEVYGYDDQAEQSIFFTVGVLETIKKLGEKYDIIHANDWQTGLLPVYLKSLFRGEEIFRDCLMIYTIHNLGYQGRFPSRYMNFASLPHYLFNVDALEFYGEINFMKGGILFADIVTTVSPTYAQEIQTKAYGEKLEGVLSIRSESLYGILNGIDYEIYNPENGKLIPFKYDCDDLSGKILAKSELQRQAGLPVRDDVPVIGLISRLVSQKGLDILSQISKYLFLNDVQFVLLGTGDIEYEQIFGKLSEEYPQKVSANLKFDIDLANLIYAGSDMFLMPSKYEPCGLGQMYSLRYGTIPIVHYTGGLSDTIKEFEESTELGNGFGFHDYKDSELLLSIMKARYFYDNKDKWNKIMQNAMKEDLSWERSAKEYIYVYKEGLRMKGRS